MITITIRDKKLAEEQSSHYIVLITRDATSYVAYETIEEFIEQWYDTLSVMKLNSRTYHPSQKALVLTSDYKVNDLHVYTPDFEAMQGEARECKLLSNGSKQRGAILVDEKNKQTTFFRLNPNDKEYIK